MVFNVFYLDSLEQKGVHCIAWLKPWRMPTLVYAVSGSTSMNRSVARVTIEPINFE